MYCDEIVISDAIPRMGIRVISSFGNKENVRNKLTAHNLYVTIVDFGFQQR